MAPNKKSVRGKKKESGKSHWRSIVSIVMFITGVIFLFSQLSFLWELKSDLSAIDLTPGSAPVRNIFGKIGAYVGYKTVYSGFGFSAVLISLAWIVTAWQILVRTKWYRIVWLWIITFFSVLYFSVFFALILPENSILAGVSGIQGTEWLKFYLGRTGSLLLWFLIAAVLAVYKFKIEPDRLSEAAQKVRPRGVRMPRFVSKSPEEKISGKTGDEESGKDTDMPDTTGENHTDVDLLISVSSKENTGEGDNVTVDPEQVSDENTLATNLEIRVGKEVLTTDNQLPEEETGPYDPKKDLSRYQYPHFGLLKDYENVKIRFNERELKENNDKIIKTLSDFGIEIQQIKANVGPSVTLYEIIPKPGVRISKIKNLEDDIAMSLAALGIRIIAPMPGRGTIGIEVPNKKRILVPLKRVLRSKNFQNARMELPIAMGKTISNETFVFDLVKMPHLLIAGATGQGKSVGLNVIINSLLFKKHPAELKFVMVDPKKVELSLYNTIEKHFLAKLPGEAEAIISDVTKVKETLNSLTKEMENRYMLLKQAKARNIIEYNKKFTERLLNPNKGHRYLPYIVLIIDEFGDFIMTAGKEVEAPIARLAQMARAVGIHMIIATQRPSVNIITGMIKANFPARIAFRVASQVDSRTIIDQSGAEKLVGKGDMLITTGSDLIRLQCAFVETDEVERVTDFIGKQQSYPSAYELPEPEVAETLNDGMDDGDFDPLFKEAAYIIVSAGQGSASLLQRKLKIGYNRAGRLIDQMEQAGLVGPSEGSKPRQVYIKDVTELDKFFEKF
jgi:S-DNA-T family DNA segregation ATPase FtsK/SpoIIIE